MRFASATLALLSLTMTAIADDVCYFGGNGPIGVPDATCAGSNGNPYTDVLSCPNPADAARICGADSTDSFVRDQCKSIVGSGSYCNTEGGSAGGGVVCYCVNGNFCCDQNADVPGGQSAVDYYKQQGCGCGDEI